MDLNFSIDGFHIEDNFSSGELDLVLKDFKEEKEELNSIVKEFKDTKIKDLLPEGETYLSILNKPYLYKDTIIKLSTLLGKELSIIYKDRIYLLGWDSNQSLFHQVKKLEAERSEIEDQVSDEVEWFPCNPSIIEYEKGYLILQRLVNFTSDRATNYKSLSSDGKIKTRNILLFTDSNFKVIKNLEVKDESDRIKYPRHIEGLEDLQIFEIKTSSKSKKIGFFCTLVDSLPNGVPQMGFGIIDLPQGIIKKVFKLTSGGPGITEKNWLPYIQDETINFIYKMDTMKRFSIDIDNPLLKQIGTSGRNNQLRDIRCGGGPVSFDEGFLLIGHEVIWINGGRSYLHRFVFTDINYNPKRCSSAFTFEDKDIEFARSMILSKKKIIIGVGIEDKNSYLYFAEKKVIREMLIFNLL